LKLRNIKRHVFSADLVEAPDDPLHWNRRKRDKDPTAEPSASRPRPAKEFFRQPRGTATPKTFHR
jgi:hypothetical protein